MYDDLLQKGVRHLLEDIGQGAAPRLCTGNHPVERTAKALADAIPQWSHFIDNQFCAFQFVAPCLYPNDRIETNGLRRLLHSRQ